MARPTGRGAPLGRLLSGLAGGRNATVDIPGIDPVLRPDAERLKRELDVLEAARADGRTNTPPTASRTLNEPQQRIVDRVAEGMARLNRATAERLGEALIDAGRRLPRTLDEAAAAAAMDARIASVLHDRRSGLVELREAELETRRNLSYFRRRHGLNRAANYRASSLLFFAVIIGSLVLESFANAFLLRRIAEQGLIGGVVLAALISAVNVALGVIAGGVGWRLVGHKFPPQRLLGLFTLILAHSGALLWNLFVAHFREVAEAAVAAGTPDLGGYTVDTLRHIRQNGWFGLSGLLSWGLFAIGLTVHLFVSREAWDDMADRYWDYKRYDQTYRRARGDYEDAVADAKGAALDDARAVLNDLEDQHERQAAARAQIAEMAELAERRLQEARDAESEWVRTGAALLRAYRDENRLVRTDPAPAWFADQSVADDFRNPALDAEAEQSRRASAEAVASLHKLVSDAQKLQDFNGDVLGRLNARLSEQVAGLLERIDALKATIDSEAERNLAASTAAAAPIADPIPESHASPEPARGAPA
ncbi:MAG: hypothetical protein KY449_00365 [Proteobacteria bacterium]|nr:hypothetical protein [Pseudomonadota bacterium]